MGDASAARSKERAPESAFGRSRDASEAAPVLASAPERASSSRESASEAVSSSLSSRTLRIAAASLAFSTEALCVPARFFENAVDVERPAFRLSAAASRERVSFSSSFASVAASNSRSSASNSASSSSSRALFFEALLGADLDISHLSDLFASPASAAGRVDERVAGAETNSPARFALASSATRLCLSPRLRNGRGAADDASLFAGGVFS